MGAFMIALAADAPPAIIECREHKPASAREYPQFSIAFGSRSATWARAIVLGPLSRQPVFLALKSSLKSACRRTSAPRFAEW
jgi:hypothetical protein